MNQEANLYIRMWSVTRDPEYIRLFREAIVEAAKHPRYSMNKTIPKRTESSGETMDDDKRDWASALFNEEGLSHRYDANGFRYVVGPPIAGLLKLHQEQSSPDRGITEEQLIAEIEGKR